MPTARTLSLLLALCLLAPLALAQQTDWWPTCDRPQQLTPLAPVALTGQVLLAAAAWNGTDFAVLWSDLGLNLWFQRVYADGTTAGAPVHVAWTSDGARPAALVWNGLAYGAAWQATDGATGIHSIVFALLDRNGAKIVAPVVVSGLTGEQVDAHDPALAWSGTSFLVAWHAVRPHLIAIRGTLLDGEGAVTHFNFPISADGGVAHPAAAWSSSSERFVVVWEDHQWPAVIRGAPVRVDGIVPFETTIVGPGASDALEPALVDAGGALGLAWQEYREGNLDTWFARLRSDSLSRIGADVRVSLDEYPYSYSLAPQLLWIGGEYGVFWRDDRAEPGCYDAWFQRISVSGAHVGPNTPVTFAFCATDFAAAFATRGFIALPFRQYGALFAQPFGCAAPGMPTCPEGVNAYNISGSGATIAWLPSVDTTADIAYYEVFRDAMPVGATSDTGFNDLGLAPGVTYQYNVRSVNAGQIVSAPCPDSQIYVRSSDAITLTVDRAAGDIALDWNDAGQNGYRVMRGTTPQVMREIQRTAETSAVDANAATGTTCYFYSIDP